MARQSCNMFVGIFPWDVWKLPAEFTLGHGRARSGGGKVKQKHGSQRWLDDGSCMGPMLDR